MSIQPDQSPTLDKETINSPTAVTTNNFFSQWKFKITIVGLLLLIFVSVLFYWQHIVAVMGMKSWVSHAEGKPIDCMIKDTNNDQYISCTAMVREQIVPLECGTSIFNMGCRVNYGSASPSFRTSK